MRVNLGDRVRDMVTGLEGVTTTVADHLTGCRRFWVEMPAKDGKSEGLWIDESRLNVVESSAIRPYADEVAVRPSPANVGHPRASGSPEGR